MLDMTMTMESNWKPPYHVATELDSMSPSRRFVHVVAGMKLAHGKYLIGVGKWIPWLSTDDRRLFRRLTEGQVCFVTGSTFRTMHRPGNDTRKFVVATKSLFPLFENTKNVIQRSRLDHLIQPDGTPTEWWDAKEIMVIGGPFLYGRTAPASIILSEIKTPWKVSQCEEKMHYYVVPSSYRPRTVILETEEVLCQEYRKEEGALSC